MNGGIIELTLIPVIWINVISFSDLNCIMEDEIERDLLQCIRRT